MKFTKTSIPGVVSIEIEPHVDERGFFARTYCALEFSSAGIEAPLIQNSMSYSKSAGTLRGMHFHAAPFQQTRLIRCISGEAFTVALDLRPTSPAFLEHITSELTAESSNALFIPTGVALGYQTACDNTIMYYQMSELYDPEFERGVRWNDPAFSIKWPDANRIMNERDATYPDFDADTAKDLV